MAELSLQELKSRFLTRPTQDLGFDFLVGFTNSKRGVNTFVVEVKSTEQSVLSSFAIDRGAYRRMVNSNVPAFLLVVDVKGNKIFCAWPERGNSSANGGPLTIGVPVTEMNRLTRAALRERLLKPD